MRKILLGLSLLLGCGAWLYPSKQHPNVILIMTDDQGWGDLSIHQNSLIETPHIDQLARESAQAERFFVSPLCAPTRASLLTGRYHLRTGTVSVSGGWERMRAEETTLAEVFKSNGYTTGCFGKWHNGEHFPENANGQGFDTFFGFNGGHLNNYFNATLNTNGQPVRTQGFITDVLTDAAIKFIGNNRHKPFFCYIPYNAPHSPFQVPDKYFNKYKAKGLTDELSSVYGMVENLDDNIGRLLAYLQNNQLTDNTIVIFMTDNGPNGYRFNGAMKGIKGSTDEGGTRVPFFVRWPQKINAGQQIKEITAHIDVMPTLVELCELNTTPTEPIDGISLASALLYRAPLPNRMIFTHTSGYRFTQPNDQPASVRTNQYRLVMKDSVALYDMMVDPNQTQNIAATNQEATQTLQEAYKKWFSEATTKLSQPRPIPLGYTATESELQAPEAHFNGHLRYKQGSGWANDWLIEWCTPSDTIWWDVEAKQATTYQVAIKYSCSVLQMGAMISAGVGNQKVSKTMLKAFDPPFLPSPDRVPRKEVYEKNWAVFPLGKLIIPKGKHRIWITAIHVPSDGVVELKSLILKRS